VFKLKGRLKERNEREKEGEGTKRNEKNGKMK
jgi:hypothetical protein